jgi:hypothetical protein
VDATCPGATDTESAGLTRESPESIGSFTSTNRTFARTLPLAGFRCSFGLIFNRLQFASKIRACKATVVLPEWFEVLNRDFRYQLTRIGTPGPNLHVAEEISGNRFKIGGGKPA